MSSTSAQSADEYEEDTSDGQVNTATDNIVNDTQQVTCAQTETMKDEQSDKHNSMNEQDEDQDQLPSNVIIETVQYEDYINQKNGHDDETNDNEGMIEEDDDSDSVQWIEHDHESSAKKSKIDLTQANNAQAELIDQSPRQATGEAQPNQMNKRIITVHLQCPQSNCFDTFPEGQLNLHMLVKHFLGPHRCLVKECEQAFDNKHILREHIKQAHQKTAQWHCGKCVKHFAEYTLLYRHNVDYHQIGHFQCFFPSCAFTGEYKKKMTNHYESQHKPELVCAQSGCLYRTRNLTYFKAHKRSHLGIEPYHCKWPDCHYSNAFQNNAMKHIMRTHFKSRSKTRPDMTHLGKPKDYLEAVP